MNNYSQQQPQPYAQMYGGQPYVMIQPQRPPVPPAESPAGSGKFIPLILSIISITVTIAAIALAIYGSSQAIKAPAISGTQIYSSSLLVNDGAWNFHSTANSQCAFSSQGLDATMQQTAQFDMASCNLTLPIALPYQLKVTIQPQNVLSNNLNAAVYLSQNVRFVISSQGTYDIEELSSQGDWISLHGGSSIQWYTSGVEANTLQFDVSNNGFSIAINGAETDHFTGWSLSGASTIGLGAVAGANPGEALFTNLAVYSQN